MDTLSADGASPQSNLLVWAGILWTLVLHWKHVLLLAGTLILSPDAWQHKLIHIGLVLDLRRHHRRRWCLDHAVPARQSYASQVSVP